MKTKYLFFIILVTVFFLPEILLSGGFVGGISKLSGLGDVDTTNASDNEVLTYQTDTWKVLNGPQFQGGTNTFNITNGTASLDVAAGATVDINSSLTVSGGSTINQDVSTTASPYFNSIAVAANQRINLEGSGGDTYIIFNSTDGEIEMYVNNILVGEWK